MSGPKQGCGTCVYADFWRTPTGQIKKGYASRCLYPVGDIALPSVPAVHEIHIRVVSSVWPDYGADCKMYEKRVDE